MGILKLGKHFGVEEVAKRVPKRIRNAKKISSDEMT